MRAVLTKPHAEPTGVHVCDPDMFNSHKRPCSPGCVMLTVTSVDMRTDGSCTLNTDEDSSTWPNGGLLSSEGAFITAVKKRLHIVLIPPS